MSFFVNVNFLYRRVFVFFSVKCVSECVRERLCACMSTRVEMFLLLSRPYRSYFLSGKKNKTKQLTQLLPCHRFVATYNLFYFCFAKTFTKYDILFFSLQFFLCIIQKNNALFSEYFLLCRCSVTSPQRDMLSWCLLFLCALSSQPTVTEGTAVQITTFTPKNTQKNTKSQSVSLKAQMESQQNVTVCLPVPLK